MLRPALLTLLLASGCTQNATSSYEGAAPTAAPSTVRPVALPAVRIATVRGTSNNAARSIRDRLRASLERRGVPVVRGAREGAVRIDGRFAPLSEGNSTTVTFEWTLANESGPIGAINGFERAPGGSSDPWRALNGDTLERMSERTAERLVTLLRSKGRRSKGLRSKDLSSDG